QSIHLRLALPAVSSSRAVFEKPVLGSSTQHTSGCKACGFTRGDKLTSS
ncbi:hypothetical protein Nmel_006050, partial [Mimus melanotis]